MIQNVTAYLSCFEPPGAKYKKKVLKLTVLQVFEVHKYFHVRTHCNI